MKRRRRKKLSRDLLGAIVAGDRSRVGALLRRGADAARGPLGNGATPLYTAAVQGETEIARLLLAAGAPPDAESRGVGSEGTPLCAAACWGHTATVHELLAFGADPGLREDGGTGWTPLEWAERGAHAETAALLVAAGGG
ncbi:ankyrin repeat domain-containing protein [Streptomyces sp. NPDC090306]|uniref:ankyrin repeat domain-containing protein n=1 Tax=Streptomyces sp. NPDC090306 TaxID=3365961 RepID=UPI003819292A